ncbi:hypothetical protein BXZ70DRAFT_923311 [Cristinia sonorae]|uniref:Uncharacterized protein n=1 Tax=Cristinia sonorae TaxID=1940300 RepID=A0A8K0XT42_9AGAR|nr:hypothetical protein BXZ70DRAFT_923311 [Cristinia sonorae]
MISPTRNATMGTEEPLWRPRMPYRSRNGFLDSTRLQMQEQSTPPEPDPAVLPRIKRDEVQKQRFAEHVLRTKGTYFPELDELQAVSDRPETASSVKETLTELKEAHRKEVEELYEYEARLYLAEAMDRYLSKDEASPHPDIEKLYSTLRFPTHYAQSDFTSSWEATRYAHLKSTVPLQQLSSELQQQEQAIQRQKDSRFPINLAQYYQIRNKETQLRIARFLAADSSTRDRMMSEFGWAWRQVNNLVDEYQHNAEFSAEVRERLRDLESTDPRRRAAIR